MRKAVIVAARAEECLAVKELCEDKLSAEFRTCDFTAFSTQRTVLHDLELHIAFALDQGPTFCASLIPEIIYTIKPSIILMTGVCAGLRGPTSLGDILIPQWSFDYSSGKETDKGHKPSPRQFNASRKLYQWTRFNQRRLSRWRAWSQNSTPLREPCPTRFLLRAMYELGTLESEWLWLHGIDARQTIVANKKLIPEYDESITALLESGKAQYDRDSKRLSLSQVESDEIHKSINIYGHYREYGEEPKATSVKFVNYGSGPAVRADTVFDLFPAEEVPDSAYGRRSKAFTECLNIDRDIHGLDMESHAFYQALFHHQHLIEFLVVKAVVDHADSVKDDFVHAHGKEVAAAYCLDLLMEYHSSQANSGGAPLIESIQVEPTSTPPTGSFELTVIDELGSIKSMLAERVKGTDHDSTRLETARELLLAQQPNAARMILKGLSQEQSSDSTFLARVQMNLGACDLMEGRDKDAGAHFMAALKLDPRNIKCLINAAVASLIGNEPEKALELIDQALIIEPSNADALLRRLEILRRLDKLPPETDFTKSVTMKLLGASVAFEKEDLDTAEALCRQIINEVPGKTEAISASVLLSKVLTHRVRLFVRTDFGPVSNLPDAQLAWLTEAERLLTSAISQLAALPSDAPRILHLIYERALTWFKLGREVEALAELERVPETSEIFLESVKLKGLILYTLKRWKEAVTSWSVILPDQVNAVRLPLAQSLAECTQYEEAEELLKEGLADNPDVDEKSLLLLSLIDLSIACNRIDEVPGYLERIKELRGSSHPEYIHGKIKYLVRTGMRQQAIEEIREAIANCDQVHSVALQLFLANEYFDAREFAAASQSYDRVYEHIRDPRNAERFLASLFNSGNYRRTREVALQIRDTRLDSPARLKVEISVAALIGDLQQAISITEQLLGKYPGDSEFAIRLVEFRLRRGETEKAIRDVDSVLSMKDIESRDLVFLGGLLIAHGFVEKGILVAYRGRISGKDDEECHLKYVGLALRADVKATIGTVSEVQSDASVLLSDGITDEWYTLEDVPTIPERSLRLDHPLALALMGKVMGDEFQYETPSGTGNYSVKSVLHKYERPAQETLVKFSTFFPQSTALRKIRAVDEEKARPSEELLEILSEQEERGSLALQAYWDGKISLYTFARSIGGHVMPKMFELTRMPTPKTISMALGAVGEFGECVGHSSSVATIVPDLTLLVSLWRLGLLRLVARLFDTVYVAQATLDELRSLIANSGLHVAGSIGTSRGQFFMRRSEELTPASSLEAARDILEFLQSCVVFPAEYLLELEPEVRDPLIQFVGQSPLHSLCVAKATGSLFAADDVFVHHLARFTFDVRYSFTQAIIVRAFEAGLIRATDRLSHSWKLFKMGYFHVALQADEIAYALRDEEFRPDPYVLERLVKSIATGPVDFVCRFLSEVLIVLLVLNAPPELLDKLATRCLFSLWKSQPGIDLSLVRDAAYIRTGYRSRVGSVLVRALDRVQGGGLGKELAGQLWAIWSGVSEIE